MTTYSKSYYGATNGIQPLNVVGLVIATVPAVIAAALPLDPLSVARLDDGTLAPLGLGFDPVLSTVSTSPGAVVRTVFLYTRQDGFVNGDQLWQTDYTDLGITYATQGLFIGEFAMTSSCSSIASPIPGTPPS